MLHTHRMIVNGQMRTVHRTGRTILDDMARAPHGWDNEGNPVGPVEAAIERELDQAEGMGV